MNEETRPARGLWNLEGWGLRWKVTAVLAIPLTVAMVLGGMRVQDELSRAMKFGSAADQVVDVPAIVALGTDFGLASAGYSAKTMMPEDLDAVDASIEKVRTAAANPELPAEVAEQLTGSVKAIEEIQAVMRANAPVDPNLPARTSAIREDLSNIIDMIVGPIDDPAVVTAHTHLADAWSAQRRLADQVTGALALLKDPDASLTDYITASGAEIAMIDSLARSFPDAADKTTALRDGVNNRLAMIDEARGGPLPLLELRASLINSVGIYSSLVAEASDSITATVTDRADETRSAALRDAAIVLVTLLAALVLALLVSRSLVGPIRRLRLSALQVARKDLPDAIDRVMAGDAAAVDDFEPVPVHTTEEIGQLARAVDDIHGQALKLAGEQAHLRMQIGDMFETLARRSKSLVDQQLGLIESLEFEEKDPKRLESLFRLDHLAARMRRNGDNLLILSGTPGRRSQSAPVQLGDVVRAAMSEVEEYQRVQVGATPTGALSGAVATDIVHLLAELLDNSLRASPPDTRVRITFARAVDGGVVLEVTDQGIGIPEPDLAVINERLASGGQVGPETARHMGLFVASRLAGRHGLTVRLRASVVEGRAQGITASVHIPASLLMSPVEMDVTGPQVRLDTAGMPQVTVVQSGQMPQLVTGSTPSAPTPSAPMGLRPSAGGAVPAPLPQPGTLFGTPPPSSEGAATGTAAPAPAEDVNAGFDVEATQTIAAATDSAPAPAAVPAPEPAAEAQPPVAPSTSGGLPKRVPGATAGLPQRTPGASGAPRPVGSVPPPVPAPAATATAAPAPHVPASPAPAAPQPMPTQWPATESGDSGLGGHGQDGPGQDGPGQDGPGQRHRYRSNPVKTASFFQNRPPVPPTQDVTSTGTPIFSGMVSDWLTDPTDPGGTSRDWNSAADEGWRAAERAADAAVDRRTESGLPQRTPGRRLVPGSVDSDGTGGRLRDPAAVRDNLSRHQMGIRAGRAASQAERNNNGGDR